MIIVITSERLFYNLFCFSIWDKTIALVGVHQVLRAYITLHRFTNISFVFNIKLIIIVLCLQLVVHVPVEIQLVVHVPVEIQLVVHVPVETHIPVSVHIRRNYDNNNYLIWITHTQIIGYLLLRNQPSVWKANLSKG